MEHLHTTELHDADEAYDKAIRAYFEAHITNQPLAIEAPLAERARLARLRFIAAKEATDRTSANALRTFFGKR